MNDNTSLSNRRILWERIKRPAVFVIVCFAASFALLFLQNKKSDFEKVNNAPLVIVEPDFKAQTTEWKDENRNEPNDKFNKQIADQTSSMRLASSEAVINQARKEQLKQFTDKPTKDIDKMDGEEINKALADIEKLKPQPNISTIINKSIVKVQYETFKNEEELINKIYQVTKKLEEDELKKLENDYSTAEKNLLEAESQEKLYHNFINDNPSLGAENLKIKISESSLNYSASLVNTLNEIKKSNPKIWEKSDSNPIKTTITDKLSSKKDGFRQNLEDIMKKFNDVDRNFEAVYGLIFKTLKNKEIIDKKLFVKTEQNPFLKNILDGKNGLSVAYWLMEITLKVIIVLALLFVILIPLKHIFFITTSSDYLVDQGRKSIDKVSAATIGLTTITKAVVVTAATIGIGAAALAGQTFSANAEPEDNQNVANNSIPIRKDQPEKSNLPKDKTTTLQLPPEIAALRSEMKTLQQTVSDLNDAINQTDLVELKKRFETVETNTNKLIEVVGTKQQLEDNRTIAQQTSKFSSELAGKNAITDSRFERIEQQITPQANQDNLFAKIKNVSSLIGEQDDVVDFDKKLENMPENPKNITQAVRTMWIMLGARDFSNEYIQVTSPTTKPNTLFEAVKYIGDPNDPKTALPIVSSTSTTNQLQEPTTLFGKINYVSSSIGTNEYLKSPESSIYSTLGKLSNVPHADGKNPAAQSLLEISKKIEENAFIIQNNTADIGRYVLGGEGGSFFTQIKNLGSDERYLVTDFSVAVLEKFYETDADVKDILKIFKAKLDGDKTKLNDYAVKSKNNSNLPKPELTFLNKPLPEKEITKGLGFSENPEKAKKWKKVKQKILQYLRVSRY